ncbi:ABC transporter ATP-binding protein [Ensifer sp. ENS04]|uniref:ABC transporter ATP-binding protein n=1 Tax=Ensifer sp. ENS04 TaxID=2769281 RepID=UPI00177E5755|nr:ABC transporter ATP-binding protein [Ensifer sp. ENS04]MBD9541419.1 ABC transporter ATP-binding protein [Ensifer sp. ENS04]
MTLVLENLNLVHDTEVHLNCVSASFAPGRLTTVLGRALAGKTTLLRAIAGLQPVESGKMERDGVDFGVLPPWLRDVAMVYQQFINYPHLNVFDNVAFPLRKRHVAEADVRNRVNTALSMVGLSDFSARKPSALSGGQQQRVALARALVRRAGILLMDEPLVNLDYKLREQLREGFRGLLASQSGGIVIYNTTEPAEAMMLGDQIIVMHEGRVLQAGAPADVFDYPANVAVAGIINDPPMTILAGRLHGGRICFDGGLELSARGHLAKLPPGAYRFGIRATEINLTEAGGVSGHVTFSEVSGSETFLHVVTALGEAVVQLQGIHHVLNGARISLSFSPERLFVFAAHGEGKLLRAPKDGEN